MKPKSRLFYRSSAAGPLLETFLISAIASVVLIRAFLASTGYPQLGGGGVHIAHMMWGGLFMTFAILIMLSSLGRRTMTVAALFGGIGFGTFIDEIGKFITSDNDYFYRPAVAIIYAVFVVLFFATRLLNRTQPLDEQEAEMNALRELEEVVHRDLSQTERSRIESYLDSSNPRSPFVIELRQLLAKTKNAPDRDPHSIVRLKRKVESMYQHVVDRDWFRRVIIVLFVGQALLSLGFVLVSVVGIETASNTIGDLPFSMNANVVSASVSLALIGIGVWYLPKERLHAYEWFSRALLFDIFVTQIFVFYRDQFSAIIGLVIKIALLIAVQYAIAHERSKNR